MCHNARSGSQVAEEIGAQPDVDSLCEIHGDNRRVAEILLEKASRTELHEVGNTCFCRVLVALFDSDRIDIDTDAAGAEFLSRHDDKPPVAAPEVINHIVLRPPGEREHSLDNGLVRGHVRNDKVPPVDLREHRHRNGKKKE